MKRIIVLTVIFLCSIFSGVVFAQDVEIKMPYIKFMGNKYTLFYSAKNQELNGYINEYYKQREGYTNWTELLGLHHYPNAFYPIEHAQAFKSYLNEKGIQTFIEADEEENSAILDFVIINDKKLPIVLEFNVFKYVKSPICGTLALQYAKRYLLSNGLEAEMVKKEFAKTRQKYVKKVKKVEMPDLVTIAIEQGKYLNPPVKESQKIKKQEFITKEEKEFFYEDKLLNIKTDNIEQSEDITAVINKEKSTKTEQFMTKEEKEFFNTDNMPKIDTDNMQEEVLEESQ